MRCHHVQLLDRVRLKKRSADNSRWRSNLFDMIIYAAIFVALWYVIVELFTNFIE
jgi:hypothetical protein